MAARNVNLTDHLAAFVDAQVASGRHQNASEVVREALRRYQDDVSAEAARIEAIRAMIHEGRAAMAAGDFTTIADDRDAEALLAGLTRRTGGAGQPG
jgi:antitoxin ParD1/3/4